MLPTLIKSLDNAQKLALKNHSEAYSCRRAMHSDDKANYFMNDGTSDDKRTSYWESRHFILAFRSCRIYDRGWRERMRVLERTSSEDLHLAVLQLSAV